MDARSQILPMHRVEALLIFRRPTKLQNIHDQPDWEDEKRGEQREADEDSELFHFDGAQTRQSAAGFDEF